MAASQLWSPLWLALCCGRGLGLAIETAVYLLAAIAYIAS
jgi:hypothetical protein